MDANLEYYILKEINSSPEPIGANALALKIDTSSPATIGRALQSLEYQGLIEKVSNKGRLLTEAGKARLSSMHEEMISSSSATHLLNLILTPQDLPDYINILKTRLLLETAAAHDAALKITDSEIQELTDLLSVQDTKQSQGELGEEENLLFHCRIAEISGNMIIAQILKLIMTQKTAYTRFSYIYYRTAALDSAGHTHILDALRSHDSGLASKEMEKHLSSLLTQSIFLEECTNH